MKVGKLIIIGAILLFYAMLVDTENIYLKISGLVILMIGLYTATRNWVGENKNDENDTE